MVILDTDHMSIIDREQAPLSIHLRNRLKQPDVKEVATTIISYEEQMRGWLSLLAKAKAVRDQVVAYRKLKNQMVNYAAVMILDFDERAAVEFQNLKRTNVRVGTMDMKIAAIALSVGATVLTRNLADFQRIPGLKVEDWTRE
jgi:tRNA(fMet)-specific endonuclease VapC